MGAGDEMAETRIEKRLGDLHAELASAAYGELPLSHRRDLYRLITDVFGGEAPVRRASIALRCATRVAPRWEARFPDDSTVSDVLGLAGGYRVNPDLTEPLIQSLGDAQTRIDDRMSEGGALIAGYAGLSALSAAHAVLYDETLDDPGSETEETMNPQEWDAAFHASLAETGGATWEEGFAPDVRRSFWTWYLDVAVREALAAD